MASGAILEMRISMHSVYPITSEKRGEEREEGGGEGGGRREERDVRKGEEG